MDEGILLVDAEEHIAASNAKARRFFDISDEEYARCATLEQLFDLIDSEKLGTPELLPEHLAGARSRKPRVLEHPTMDGRLVEVRHIPIDAGGFVRMFTDITERRRNEETLKSAIEDSRRAQAELVEQKDIANLAMENMGEGMLLVDSERRLVTYNQQARNYFNLDDEFVERLGQAPFV